MFKCPIPFYKLSKQGFIDETQITCRVSGQNTVSAHDFIKSFQEKDVISCRGLSSGLAVFECPWVWGQNFHF